MLNHLANLRRSQRIESRVGPIVSALIPCDLGLRGTHMAPGNPLGAANLGSNANAIHDALATISNHRRAVALSDLPAAFARRPPVSDVGGSHELDR